MSDSESSQDFLLTRYGTRLYRIEHADYIADAAHAVRHTELQPETTYTANSTSLLLRQHDRALTFDTRIEEVSSPYSPFALASFTLILLDPDMRFASAHRAEIDSVGAWTILDSETPIHVRSRLRRRTIETLRHGYLLHQLVDPIDTEFRSAVLQPKPEVSPPLSQQRSHPLLPVERGDQGFTPETKNEHI